jgi:hypothetical protein
VATAGRAGSSPSHRPPPGRGRSPSARSSQRARCNAHGCTNFARSGSAFCAAHKREAEDGGRRSEDEPGGSFAERVAREDQERRREAAAAFRARMDAGDYRGLFGDRLNELMEQAAADGGVADELAVLRIVMARLLAEETDPVVLAKSIARVAAVSIQAARAQRAINGQLAESLTEAITSILAEVGGGGEG